MTKPEFDTIKEWAGGIIERIDGLAIKGKKCQTDAAIHYAVGFAKALAAAGFDISPLIGWITFDLAFHGMKAVREAA